jgi:hypothetical protein
MSILIFARRILIGILSYVCPSHRNIILLTSSFIIDLTLAVKLCRYSHGSFSVPRLISIN